VTRSGFARYTFGFIVAAAMLAGCGGSQRVPAYTHAVTTTTFENEDEFGTLLATDDSFETVYEWYKKQLPGAQVSDLTGLSECAQCQIFPTVLFTVSNGSAEITASRMQTEITILNKKPTSRHT
jgi:hypothetical protein